MREPQVTGRHNVHPQGRRLSPLARIIVFVPLALLFFAYTRTWDMKLLNAARSLSLQVIAQAMPHAPSSKPTSFTEVQAAGPTFSRSWYVYTPASTAMSDMQALAQQDAAWTVHSQQCDEKHYASFVLLDFGEPHTFSGIYGTFTVKTNNFWADTDIAAAAQRYLVTWRGVSPNCRLKLALGLSNHHQCTYDGSACQIPEVGIRWAEMVNSLNSWIQSQGYDVCGSHFCKLSPRTPMERET